MAIKDRFGSTVGGYLSRLRVRGRCREVGGLETIERIMKERKMKKQDSVEEDRNGKGSKYG